MEPEQIKEQIEKLERKIFILEMDDFAYTKGAGAIIAVFEAKIRELKAQLN